MGLFMSAEVKEKVAKMKADEAHKRFVASGYAIRDYSDGKLEDLIEDGIITCSTAHRDSEPTTPPQSNREIND